MGFLFLDITQDLFSRITIKEISPLEEAELLGSIGGFWGEQNVSRTFQL